MVKLNKIYTKTGDDGSTGLSDGSRVLKSCQRVEVYGFVDEANSAIGVARLSTTGEMDAMLERIQHDLFDLGADLSTPIREGGEDLRILPTQVERLEHEIDAMNAQLAPLNSFVLPGGTPAAAHLHVARTIVRRAEREAYRFAEKEKVNADALHYLNRLSDHLFVLARYVNDKGAKDVLWKPGVNR